MTAAIGALIGGALVLFTVCFVAAINNAAQWVSDQADKKAAAREAASSFCRDFVPQVDDVAAIDAGLPKMGADRAAMVARRSAAIAQSALDFGEAGA